MAKPARTPYSNVGGRIGCFTIFCLLVLGAPAWAQSIRVVAFGDSVTHGLGDVGVSCTGSSGGYPPRLESRLNGAGFNVRIVTSGVCGEHTSQGVSRIEGVLRNNPGKVVLIMEGTNDLSNRNISTESMRFNLNSMAAKGVSRGFVSVLTAPIPRDESETDVDNARTAFLGSLLKIDAAAKGYGFVPAFEEMIGIPDLYDLYYADPFHPNAGGYRILSEIFYPEALAALQRALHLGPCQPDGDTLCLAEKRFRVEVTWTDFEGRTGVGRAVVRTDNTGFFWFFGPDNLELMVKVLDGRELNDHFWVFYGALSNVGFQITVTDSETGRRRVYGNQLGDMASVGDTTAFLDFQ